MKTETIIAVLVFLVVSAIIGAILWPYTINTWLVFFGKTASITWVHGAILGVVPMVGQFSIPAAAVTWITMLFLV